MMKAKLSDVLLIGVISGVTAIATSYMGITGTLLGSVISSMIIQILNHTFRDPITNVISEKEKLEQSSNPIHRKHSSYKVKYEKVEKNTSDSSFVTSRLLFIFPLIIILAVELINFSTYLHLIPSDLFYQLESITNWSLFRTVGIALILMSAYPLMSDDFKKRYGLLLLGIGIVNVILGFADTNNSIAEIYELLFTSIREYINIAIIISLLYIIFSLYQEIQNHKSTPLNQVYNSDDEINDIYDETNNFDEGYYDNKEYNNRHHNHKYYDPIKRSKSKNSRKRKNKKSNNFYKNDIDKEVYDKYTFYEEE